MSNNTFVELGASGIENSYDIFFAYSTLSSTVKH